MTYQCNCATKFLSVKELASTDAATIYNAVKEAMSDHDLDVANMVGLATDGASVMVGVRNGVTTRFKADNPVIVSTRCMAHRLQLASEKAANGVPLIAKYIGSLNQFAKTLKYSPKLKRILIESKELHQEKANQIQQVFFTRWLSFSKSVTAMAVVQLSRH